MPDVFGIAPDHAGFQRIFNAQRPAHLAGPDIAGKAVLHAIGDRNGVGFVLERNHRQERTEHFLLRDTHVGAPAGD